MLVRSNSLSSFAALIEGRLAGGELAWQAAFWLAVPIIGGWMPREGKADGEGIEGGRFHS